MNKLIIILLAVCLVSVHAFVKRDAAETTETPIIKDLQNQIETIKKKVQENINPETIKKGVSDTIDSIIKALNTMKPTEAPKP